MCSIDGCDRPQRTPGQPLCNTHYFRVRRTGDAGGPEVWDRKKRPCGRDDCDRDAYAHGLCLNHLRHQRKGGVGSTTHWGETNGSWVGDDVGYNGAHDRVRKRLGSARLQTCACGAPALHWAYQHTDPNELRDGRGIPYSGDPSHYAAMCVPCHKRMDLDYIHDQDQETTK